MSVLFALLPVPSSSQELQKVLSAGEKAAALGQRAGPLETDRGNRGACGVRKYMPAGLCCETFYTIAPYSYE